MNDTSGSARMKPRKEKIVVIKGMDGSILWKDEARSQRAAVAIAVRAKISLAGADLRGFNLSRLDLTDARMDGACFDGADLRGCTFRNASLVKASMTAVKGQGATFDIANMHGITISDSDFTGSTLVYADMRHSQLTRTHFDDANAASCRMDSSVQKTCSWNKAEMFNAEFMDSTITECSFKGAKLGHRAFTNLPKEERDRLCAHLPNRTARAKVVGCVYDKSTQLSDTVPAMKADRRSTSLTRNGLWGASTLGVVTGVDKAFEVASELGHTLGMHDLAAGGIIVAIAAATLLRESVIERLREGSSEKAGAFINAVRNRVASVTEKGVRKFDLVALVGTSRSLEPVRMALAAREPDARKAGLWQAFSTFMTGMGKVVLCDRKHLAMAMATLCSAREKGFRLKEDVTLLHCTKGCQGSSAPCALHFSKNGSTHAVWRMASGGYAIASYGKDGILTSACNELGKKISPKSMPDHAMSKVATMMAFEASILEKHGLGEFHYEKNTHRVSEGRNGALLVKRRSTGRVSNVDGQPAIVPMEGEHVFVSNGSVYVP